MDIKKCLPVIALILGGCTTTASMDRQVMNSMTIDCKHANEQIAFIQSQAPSDEDSIKNSLMIRGWSGFISSMKDGTYNARRDWDDGARSNAVRIQVYNIQKTCAR